MLQVVIIAGSEVYVMGNLEIQAIWKSRQSGNPGNLPQNVDAQIVQGIWASTDRLKQSIAITSRKEVTAQSS